MNKICSTLLGIALGIAAFVFIALAMYEKPQRERHADEFIHDGWCSLMPNCHDRCHCHDECGPLCNTWRRLVADGKVEPFGYEWKMNDPTGLVECIVRNAGRELVRNGTSWKNRRRTTKEFLEVGGGK